ncbi:hypothetical protein F0P96_02625 [Hymenobacter busanensis]|uniref:Uncharacterized protein n=1 Tax=Hymenobacter busanensis TaxID=2607656 RepID=A0A7L4ZTL3_9BACT|nr:hypothetical protein [Hymenobacter busanensis]KAA9339531.1 hypothetical protein F0P96_02625 [Hymenobacter busanensis]QHJ06714.1 hypothetical protein GUY19_05130 [Hymenobacter busanensis]
MQKFTTPESALTAFAAAAEAHAQATETGNAKSCNKAYKHLISALRWLEAQHHTSMLVHLLAAPSVGPRLWAAAYLIQHHNPQAEDTLEQLAAAKGSNGLSAETTLQEWRAGRLKL